MANNHPFITGKNLVLAAIEADSGTPETLASTDANVRGIKPVSIEFSKDMYILDESTGRHSVRGVVPGKSSATITKQIALSVGAALGTAPKWAKYAHISGLRVSAVIELSADLVTANSTAGNVIVNWGAPVAITPVVYGSSHAATMTAICNAIKTAGGTGTEAVVGGTNNRSIFVYHPTKIISVSGFAVTLGASQPTVKMRVSMRPHAAMDSTTGSLAFQMTPQTGNAVIYEGKGAIGDHTIRMAALGEPLIGEFRLLSALLGEEDGAPFVLTAPDTTFPPRTVGATIKDGANVQHIGSFELAGGHDLQLKQAPEDSTGYLMGYIANRENRLSFDPQVTLAATDNSFERWSAGTQTAFEFATAPLNGQRIVIRVPKLTILEMGIGERNGENIYSKTGIPCEDVGNDAYEISIEGPAA